MAPIETYSRLGRVLARLGLKEDENTFCDCRGFEQ